jgi:hypothetical protein
LSDTVSVLEDSKDSSEIGHWSCGSGPAAERVFTSLHREISELQRSIASIDQRAFPIGKWSSLSDDSFCPEYKSIHRFRWTNRAPFEGVIAFLTKQCGGNFLDRGVIGVKSSSSSANSSVKYIVELENGNAYYSEDCPDQWICYDLLNMRLLLSGYSIRTNFYGVNSDHPRSWVIEVTDNVEALDWIQVDHRTNNSDLNTGTADKSYAILTPQPKPFRYIRLRLTGPTHANSNRMYLQAFELFGDLYVPE